LVGGRGAAAGAVAVVVGVLVLEGGVVVASLSDWYDEE